MRIKCIILSLTLVILLGTVQAGLWSPPFQNPSFENRTLASGGYSGAILGWYDFDWTWEEYGTGQSGNGIPQAPDGNNWGGIGGSAAGSYIYQRIGAYDGPLSFKIQFAIGIRNNSAPGPIRVALWAGGLASKAGNYVGIDTTGATMVDSVTFPVSSYGGITYGIVNVSATLKIAGGYTAGAPLWLQFANLNASGQTYIDNIRLVSQAWEPDPADGAINVPLDKVLSWHAARNPNDWSLLNSEVTAHEVYMNDGTADPNVYLVATIPVTNPPQETVSYTPAAPLTREGSYYWRVDEAAGPNSITGPVWTFGTVGTSPALDPAYPADLMVFSSETATLKVVALNPFTLDATGMTYAWYKVGNTTVLSTTDTLEISNAQAADSASYFCTVTLTANGKTADSRTASLLVKTLIGHWPFDDNLNDVIAGNNGTTDTPPVYAAGKIGKGVQFSKATPNPVKLPAIAHTNLHFTLTWWSYEIDPAQDGALIASGEVGTEDFWYRRSGTTFAAFGMGSGGTYPRGQWYFHTYAYDNSVGQATWYINALRVGGQARTFHGFDDTDHLITVGAYKALTATRLYDGIIDDVRFYNYPLTAIEIGKLYAQGTGTTFCLQSVQNDLNGDCRVDIGDFALLASNWLMCNLVPSSNCP